MAEKRWDGTPVRALEWNDKYNCRCAKCKRFGPRENYKEGPLQLVDGEHVRTWLCKDGCKPPRTEHFENARPPKKYDGEDPPRRPYVEAMTYPVRVPLVPLAELGRTKRSRATTKPKKGR
jgi:hypothetical protein